MKTLKDDARPNRSMVGPQARPGQAGGGEMLRVLVAGATGYLGRFVVRELKSRGHFVRALSRKPGKLEDLDIEPDEIFFGEVTKPETLEGICDGIDVVFSSIGITRQKDGLTFRDVDLRGNLNLLEQAQRSGVEKFVYVSAINGQRLRHLDIVEAHEAFVDELKRCGLDHTVLRPTGYFSDLEEIYRMALKGRVYLFGKGTNRVNPIHGADLAIKCGDAIEHDLAEVEIGGPDVLTWRQIAKFAFAVVGKRPRITAVPMWIMATVIFLTRLFSRHQAGLLAFFATMGTTDAVGPAFGDHTLANHYQNLGDQR
jgi:uncharacterized protein YbjT (DUF2867 family)